MRLKGRKTGRKAERFIVGYCVVRSPDWRWSVGGVGSVGDFGMEFDMMILVCQDHQRVGGRPTSSDVMSRTQATCRGHMVLQRFSLCSKNFNILWKHLLVELLSF
jgi:hypothetical protein